MPFIPEAPFPTRATPTASSTGPRPLARALLVWSLLLFFPSFSLAEQMVTRLFLNGENKGEVFVHRTESGDFLLTVEDLRKAGLREPKGTAVDMEGEPHLSLRSLAGVSFAFEEQTLTLNLSADPSLLPRTVIEFSAPQSRKVHFPRESSLFLNYGLEYRAATTDGFQSLNLANELGARRGDYLFLADTLYTRDDARDGLIRLHTSVIRDDRERLRRTTFGDLFASSGSLGGGVNLGGVGVSKTFGMDPYFVTYPAFDFSGQAALPSEVDVYVNGSKVRTERVAPGEFQLRNFSAYGGAGVLELVVRDSLGREQRYRYPFYSSNNLLLKKGLHDYSYNIGFRRDEFGRESNSYSAPAAVMFHRYGAADYLTVGFRAEAGKDVVNAGPQAALRLATAGVLNLSLAASAGGGAGSAADLSYLYQNRRFNSRLFYQYFSPAYRTLAADGSVSPGRRAAGLGLGYTYPAFGSLSFDVSDQEVRFGAEKLTASVGYSRTFPGNVTLTAVLRRARDSVLGSGNEFFAGLNYTPRSDLNFSARHESTQGGESQSLQAQKNVPLGEGFGFRAQLERNRIAGVREGYAFNPMLQYNGRRGVLRGETNAALNDGKWTDQYMLGGSGAFVMLDGVAALTRPVTDSFAAVKVGDLAGVTVRYGAQDMGKTDASGRIIVPSLSAYNDNNISIGDKDIPFDYYFPQVKKLISPPLRSGSCVSFLVKKMQTVTGSFRTGSGGEAKPLEFCEAAVSVGGMEIRFQSGAGGEFYIDPTESPDFKKLALAQEKSCASVAGETGALLKPGAYRGELLCQGTGIPFTLNIPVSADPMIDLGQVPVAAGPETEPAAAPVAPAAEVAGEQAAAVAIAAAVAREQAASAALAVALALAAATEEEPAAALPDPADTVTVAGASEAYEQEPQGGLVAASLSNGRAPAQSTSSETETLVWELRFRFAGTEFASESDRLRLKEIVRFLETEPRTLVTVAGHTDQLGSAGYNKLLSKKRARRVVSLLRKMGVAEKRIARVVWFGKRDPVCGGLEEACRERNRRVLVRVLSDP